MGKLIRFRRQKKAMDEAARALFPPFQAVTSDARPASFGSDAASSDLNARPGVGKDPELTRKQVRRQRGLIFALFVVFAGGIAAALFGDHGYLDGERQRLAHAELKAVHAQRLARVDALRHEIDRLRDDPSAIERIAREDLGFVAKDEITLLLPGLDAKTGSGIVPAVRSTP